MNCHLQNVERNHYRLCITSLVIIFRRILHKSNQSLPHMDVTLVTIERFISGVMVWTSGGTELPWSPTKAKAQTATVITSTFHNASVLFLETIFDIGWISPGLTSTIWHSTRRGTRPPRDQHLPNWIARALTGVRTTAETVPHQ
jgi:hypothetical protein